MYRPAHRCYLHHDGRRANTDGHAIIATRAGETIVANDASVASFTNAKDSCAPPQTGWITQMPQMP